MKNMRLVCAALAFVLAGAWAVNSNACDNKTQATTASNKSAACTAEMAAKCTPEMRAACTAMKGTKGASFTTASANGGECAAHGAKGATFTTASAKGAADGCCAMKGATATTAAASGKANRVNAVAAGAGCSAHDAKGASAMAAGGSCSGHGAKGAMAKGAHHCDACDDLAMCGPDGLLDEGASIQSVALKNGVMFVYTAASPGQVSVIQSAMQRRGERLTKLVSAGDKASLCNGCKDFRGAMASGKLSREVVNIEGGTLVLMTSSDPVMVKKIRAMADASKTSAQVKS